MRRKKKEKEWALAGLWVTLERTGLRQSRRVVSSAKCEVLIKLPTLMPSKQLCPDFGGKVWVILLSSMIKSYMDRDYHVRGDWQHLLSFFSFLSLPSLLLP